LLYDSCEKRPDSPDRCTHACARHCANAIVFSVLNALVLRPLNVPHPKPVHGGAELRGRDYYVAVVSDYRDLRDMNRSFDSLVAYDIMGALG